MIKATAVICALYVGWLVWGFFKLTPAFQIVAWTLMGN